MWPVVLNGGEHGANLRVQFRLLAPKIGLYWFDVLWGDEPLTRIPFRLEYSHSRTGDVDEPSETEKR